MPLHRLPGHRGRGTRRAPHRAALGAARRSAAASARPPGRRSSPAPPATPSTSTSPGLLHMKLLRSPHPHARIVAIDTTAALRVPGRARGAHPPRRTRTAASPPPATSTPPRTRTTPACSTTWSASSASGSPPSSPTARPPPRRAAGAIDVDVRGAARTSSTRRRRCGPARRSCTTRAAEARIARPGNNVVGEVHGEIGDVEAGFAEADAVLRGHLPHPARPARQPGDARRGRPGSTRRTGAARRPLQHPGAVPDPPRAVRALRPAARAGPRGRRPGRRRLRRQAGDAHRGHRGAGRAAAAAGR